MTSGSTIYSKIKQKVAEVENERNKLSGEIDRYERSISNLTNQREEAFVELAEFYLPSLEAKAVKETLKEVRAGVEAIFQEKQERRSKLEEDLSKSRTKKHQMEEQYETVTAHLNDKVKERDKLTDIVNKHLAGDQNYTLLFGQTTEANERLKQGQQRVEEVSNDAKNKLPAYEANKLFMYLARRKFETEGYKGRGLFKKLDSWVAKKIDYVESKKSYDFLKSMPELMALEVEKREEELNNLAKKVEAIRTDAADKYGLLKVLAEGKAIGQKRDSLMKSIENEDSLQKSYSDEIKSLNNTKGAYYHQAIDKLKGYLKGETIQDLIKKAKDTPSERDDRLVGIIDDADKQVKAYKGAIKDKRKDWDAVNEKLEGLNEIKRKFSSNDYDSSSSSFDSDFNINAVLIAYIAGKMSSHDVWKKIDSKQNFEHRSSYSSSSSSSSWGGGSHSSGGGFGGGGFSGGGGFGGGGFSSGSGF